MGLAAPSRDTGQKGASSVTQGRVNICHSLSRGDDGDRRGSPAIFKKRFSDSKTKPAFTAQQKALVETSGDQAPS